MRILLLFLFVGLMLAGVLWFRSTTVSYPVAGPVSALSTLPVASTGTTATTPSLDEERNPDELSGVTPSNAEDPTASADGPPAVDQQPVTAGGTGPADAARRVTREPTTEERSEELTEELLEDLELDAQTMSPLRALIEERLLVRAEARLQAPTDEERRAGEVALEAALVELYGDDQGQEVLQWLLGADL